MFGFIRRINCDQNATTDLSPKARRAIIKALKGPQANPSSPYAEGREASYLIERARKDLADVVNVEPESLIFTSGATEADNYVRSIAPLLSKSRRAIVYNPMEHPAMIASLRLLEAEGFSLIALKPDRLGRIDLEELKRRWNDNICLTVMMAANNETGTLYDIAALAQFTKASGAYFFSDMVQALGKIKIDLKALSVDYASFSAHKIGGPKGVGALYARPGAPFAPVLLGGNQEGGRRAGTEAVHDIIGFGAALREVPSILSRVESLRALKENFIASVKLICPEVIINSPSSRFCQPGTVSLTFPGRDNAFLLGHLEFYGVSAAAGSACKSGDNAPSSALTAAGLSAQEARSTLRFSFGPRFSRKDLNYLVKVLKKIFSEKSDKEIIVLRPRDVTEDLILGKDLTIIHIRRFPKFKGLKPLIGSRVINLADRLSWETLKLNGPTLLTCETGYDAPIMAFRLKRRGFSQLGVLAGGLWGLRLSRPELWARLLELT
ncbi:MAG: aminotransferase class V-fold PLP-dependent enzyme [Deltaproteobacteria bacterium]|jgi:cysteine desulfurase|nr:aminotransferase class V-fold PLP-dependent enzyme [Deltaproteobacteria bacterium]